MGLEIPPGRCTATLTTTKKGERAVQKFHILTKEELKAYHDNMVAEGMSSEAALAVMEGLTNIKYDPKQSEPPKMSNSQQLTQNAKGLEKIDAEIKHVEKEMEEQVNKYHRLLTVIEHENKKNAYQRKEEAQGDTAELVGAGKGMTPKKNMSYSTY